MINGKIKAELLPSLFNDLGPVNAAKVSMGKWSNEFDGGEHDGSHTRLVRYLAKHNHFTTFTHSRETFILDDYDIYIEHLEETDIAGMVWDVVVEGIKVRHSLWGWANLINGGHIHDRGREIAISMKLKELYPNVWPVLCEPNTTNDICSGWVNSANETNPRFIDVHFRYETPVPIARQEFKHLIACTRNEISRRYVSDDVSIYDVDVWRNKPEKSVKQGSGEDFHAQELASKLYELSCKQSLETYERLIELGICTEQARLVLPQGMMVSYVITGSLSMFKRFCGLRLDSHAQKEIRALAEQVNGLLADNSEYWNKM